MKIRTYLTFSLILGISDDIHNHFESLVKSKTLPTLDELLLKAAVLRRRYASQTAYNESLLQDEYAAACTEDKAPSGSAWMPSSSIPAAIPFDANSDIDMPAAEAEDESHEPPEADVPVETLAEPISKENEPKFHVKEADFDGDRVLSNSILFIMEFGWWIELNYSVPEGDIGRVLEILKVRLHYIVSKDV